MIQLPDGRQFDIHVIRWIQYDLPRKTLHLDIRDGGISETIRLEREEAESAWKSWLTNGGAYKSSRSFEAIVDAHVEWIPGGAELSEVDLSDPGGENVRFQYVGKSFTAKLEEFFQNGQCYKLY
jgi:hypothetical protein